MVRIELPHVHTVKKRLASGAVRVYYYHRDTGTRLPDDPASASFVSMLAELNKQGILPSASKAGTVDMLINAFKASPEFLELSASSRKDYGSYLELIRQKWGQLSSKFIERKHVLFLRDKYNETPRKANYIIQVLSRLMSFGMDRGYRNDNPALKIKQLKTGEGHSAWTEEQIKQFRKVHSIGHPMRTAFELGMGTGQRRGDVIKMTWADFDGSGIAVVQNKGSGKLWVPCPSELRSYLSNLKREGVLILVYGDEKKRGYKVDHFGHQFHDAVVEAGLDGMTFHGLRYTAATALADAGCDTRDIMAITGHKTERMANKYARAADQKRRAKGAVARLDESKNKT